MKSVPTFLSLCGDKNVNYHCHKIFYHLNAKDKQSVKINLGVLCCVLTKSIKSEIWVPHVSFVDVKDKLPFQRDNNSNFLN